jgi:hypothetical protein
MRKSGGERSKLNHTSALHKKLGQRRCAIKSHQSFHSQTFLDGFLPAWVPSLGSLLAVVAAQKGRRFFLARFFL